MCTNIYLTQIKISNDVLTEYKSDISLSRIEQVSKAARSLSVGDQFVTRDAGGLLHVTFVPYHLTRIYEVECRGAEQLPRALCIEVGIQRLRSDADALEHVLKFVDQRVAALTALAVYAIDYREHPEYAGIYDSMREAQSHCGDFTFDFAFDLTRRILDSARIRAFQVRPALFTIIDRMTHIFKS